MRPEDFEFKRQYKNGIVKAMKVLRKKGATYEEIARMYNRCQIKTISGSGKWHAQSIHRLLK